MFLKNIRFAVVLCCFIAIHQNVWAQRKAAGTLPQLGKSPVKEIVKAMTLDEKVRLVIGTAKTAPMPPPVAPGTSVAPPETPAATQSTLVSQDKVAGSAGEGYAIKRFNIPALVYADGPAGVRIDAERKNTTQKYYATAFPVATLLASTWDTKLVTNVGKAMGNEVLEYGVDVLLAPGINIHRNPLTGRNFEYYSEDPVVVGSMASAIIGGVQFNNVGTSIKHFAVNNQETNRNGVNAIVSERALREIYLRGFQIAIKRSQPWTVMSAYNKINGTFASQSHQLLTTILRNEWGFKGFVMTDWWAGSNPVEQMKAGNDLIMPGHPDQIRSLKEAVANGTLSVKVLDTNVEKILNIIAKSPAFRQYKYTDKPDLKAHAALARSAATEGMVLLQNKKQTLPLSKSIKRIALFGNSGYDIIASGTGSGNVNKAYEISLNEGLTKAGFNVNNELITAYQTYLTTEKAKYPKENFWQAPVIAEMGISKATIEKMSNEADMALISVGRNSGEGEDRKLEGDYNLTPQELETIKSIAEAFHAKGKKVVAVLNIGSVIETVSWRDNLDAILLAWQPGQEGGYAITDVLTGKVNPSGKLATTFPVNYTDIPSGKNFPGTPKQNPTEVRYEEGIYVGYRYFNTFKVKPAYEFGYGMSYTSFTYSNLKLSAANFNKKLTVTVKVTNTGKVAGKEAVQLYITAPSKSMDKPAMELKAFGKTQLLQPGAAETLTFTINEADLASFNTGKSAWIAEAGNYTVKIGASSENIRQTASFKLSKDIITEKVNKVLVLQTALTELKK